MLVCVCVGGGGGVCMCVYVCVCVSVCVPVGEILRSESFLESCFVMFFQNEKFSCMGKKSKGCK